uniref:Uncharacterized protein n=1 Tax=Strombidinopsis acuminata TaxID=141414 RepID=A0A7S3X9B4_9SPIT
MRAHPLMTKAENSLNMLFLVSAVISAFACFGRADYNLPMYAFLYCLFNNQKNNKTKMMILFTLTFIGDFFWMTYWVPYYTSDAMAKWQYGLHMFVIVCSLIVWVVKIPCLILMCAIPEAEMDNSGNR